MRTTRGLPVLVLLLLAPFLGESLSGSTPPLDLLLPWNLALMGGLYGAGALLVRETARRFRFGPAGLVLLGAAYGVYEEGLVDRFWFLPSFWDEVGVGSYSVVGPVNLLLAAHLTVFHAAVSIGASIVIVERVFPEQREQVWVGPWGLGVAAVVLFVLLPFVYAEDPAPGPVALLVTGSVMLALVAAAFAVPRARQAPPAGDRRRVGIVAFLATTAHFVLVYALPSTGVPWPWGVCLSLAPIGVGVLLAGRGADGLKVVSGILSFFVLLDVVVGLGGRYDLVAGGLATAAGLAGLHRRAVTPR